MKKKVVILTGAGISAESGIATFRDSNGLWEGHDVMQVASPEGWRKDKNLVLDFYNQRRKQAREVEPNLGHLALVELEKNFDVHIITQNVDNLHERAGSTNVLHLHGELNKAQSTVNPNYVIELDNWEMKIGDKCPDGSQLRPFIVWFGEQVPKLEEAIKITKSADIFIVIGTSLVVYPAASLIDYVPRHRSIYVIDPHLPTISNKANVILIGKTATAGVPELVQNLILNY